MKMKNMIVPAILCSVVLLSACGKETASDTSSLFESIESTTQPQQETSEQTSEVAPTQPEEQSADQAPEPESSAAAFTKDQALAGALNYYTSINPGYELKGDYGEYWDVTDENPGEYTVIYRSYTGAINRYYVNSSTGETYVTEFVPGIIDEEQKTGETFNINDYLSGDQLSGATDSVTESAAPVTYEDDDGFMGGFLQASDRDKIDTTNEYGVFYRIIYSATLEGDELTLCGSLDYRNSKDQDPITISSDETHIFEVNNSTVYVMDGAESGVNNVSKEEFAGLLDKLKDSGVYLEVEISGGKVATATIIS